MYQPGEISDKQDIFLPAWERGVRQGGKMNLEAMKLNVVEFKQVMDKHGILTVLIFGTLLGVMRNGQLIPNDSDFDVFCFASDYLKWDDAKKELTDKGFVIPDRHPLHDDFVIRMGEKIDINWLVGFSKFYIYNEDIYYPKYYFDKFQKVNLFGEKFDIPYNWEQLLIDLYGTDWRIPSNKKGRINIYPK
jgi:phosphorylcholine metabolism protein LicD